jgi:hypothetical protein
MLFAAEDQFTESSPRFFKSRIMRQTIRKCLSRKLRDERQQVAILSPDRNCHQGRNPRAAFGKIGNAQKN